MDGLKDAQGSVSPDLDMFVDPDESAAYLIDMIAELADLAHRSRLQNTSFMLAAIGEIAKEERRLQMHYKEAIDNLRQQSGAG